MGSETSEVPAGRLPAPARRRDCAEELEKIFSAAKTGEVKNYFVEMDLEMMRSSAPYRCDLQVL
jgi:hypothetical protein